ncbi:MAG: flagellar export chaperone FlgN [Treponema sp.]|nr:flagellar export chaperone FlgN [Treponema sp.]
MKEAWNFQNCVRVVTDQIALLKKISQIQQAVRQAVIDKEWADFDEKTAEVNRLGEEFATLEEQRARLFSVLPNSSGQPLYAVILRLPLEESRELSRLYRELKTEALKAKYAGESFLLYINEAKAMATAYLQAVCPERGGKLYSRKGRTVSQDLKSIIFNNQF